ncbi:hypothetical protein SJAV_08290 [Sulfurisphaera javensis]|uniref:Uncharacterized protein n=1 Tax=Sulfurisphaera javensis TaxID=2049879 RepID=A0AAT9GQ24_9CREN
MPVWVKIGTLDVIFPDEESMMRVLKESGIDLNDVIVIEKMKEDK